MKKYLCCALFLASFFVPTAAFAATTTLTWTDNSNGVPPGNIEDGFIVERRNNNPPGTYAELNRTAMNVTTYADTTIVAGASYCYRIKAFNTAGTSGPSNEVCITIAIPPVIPTAPSGLQITTGP